MIVETKSVGSSSKFSNFKLEPYFWPQLAAASTTAEPSSSASATSSSSASSVPLPANIRVAVRVRPENAAEEANGAHRNVVEIVDERMLVFDPKQVNKIKLTCAKYTG